MDAWIDLTKPLDESTEIYTEGTYRDPDVAAELWADHLRQGYEVWRLELGTQTGTHIDAPRHFDPEGATIDALRPEECVGTYRAVTVAELSLTNEAPAAISMREWNGVTALVLDARSIDPPQEPAPLDTGSAPKEPAQHPARLSPQAVEAIATCPCRLIVLIGEPLVAHPDPFSFHRRLAACGKFLVEDTREDVGELPRRGHIIALPLRLTGLSGSPARLLIRGM